MSQVQPETLLKAVGLLVSLSRRSKQLSQAELGERVGLTRSAMGNFEAGRQSIYFDQLLAITDALGINLASLLPYEAMVDGSNAGFATLQELAPPNTIIQALRDLRDLDPQRFPKPAPYLTPRENESSERPKRRALRKGSGGPK